MARVLGLGALNKVDDDDSGTVFTTMVLMTDITPPPRRRVRVPATALEDVLATEGAGIEDVSDYEFMYYRDAGATPESLLHTLFTARTPVLWQLLHSDNGTETFEGIVMAIEPQGIKHNEYEVSKATIHRTGAITYA